MNDQCKKIWLCWEDHRRSRELAGYLNMEYISVRSRKPWFIRYPVLSFRTMFILLSRRPDVVVCQNPSVVLAALLSLIKPIFRFKLIVDRHSNFKFHTRESRNMKWIAFHYLSNFSIRKADLTIVTNEFLKSYVSDIGGKAFVLQDKLPNLEYATNIKLKGRRNVVFVSTFSSDEPIEEVVECAALLGNDVFIYITGDYRNYPAIAQIKSSLPPNVILTGFLPEAEYQATLKSADIIVVITDQEHTLTCGAYEAVSLTKAMVLSNTAAIREYFSKGAVYSKPEATDLARSIIQAIEMKTELEEEVRVFRQKAVMDWEERSSGLRAFIERDECAHP